MATKDKLRRVGAVREYHVVQEESRMRVLVAIVTTGVLAFAWCAHPSPARAYTHKVKHPRGRAAHVTYRRPYVELPPGYSVGGPNYTTCDRINHDRMLVGTCK